MRLRMRALMLVCHLDRRMMAMQWSHASAMTTTVAEPVEDVADG